MPLQDAREGKVGIGANFTTYKTPINQYPQEMMRAFIQSFELWKSDTAVPGCTSSSNNGRSASSKVLSIMPSASSKCASVRGPTIGAVTPGWSFVHSKENCEAVKPRS